jgi:3-oxoacyl-[acyl-carrier protein] reductase
MIHIEAEAPGIRPLGGRAALVTGATRGIGRAIALRLGTAGAAVCVTGRSVARGEAVAAEIKAAGGKSIWMSLDVTSFEETERTIGETIRQLGRLDIVVANAGIGTIGPVVDSDPADWRAMMDVNFFGTAYLAKAALTPMLAQGYGDIVVIASSAATTGYEEWAGYCASKWAVAGFMECLGREMVGKGIRVCTVCPGSVDTPFWDDLNQDLARAGTNSRAAMMSADDVAEIVLLQLRLPRTVLLKHTLTFPTNEWH